MCIRDRPAGPSSPPAELEGHDAPETRRRKSWPRRLKCPMFWWLAGGATFSPKRSALTEMVERSLHVHLHLRLSNTQNAVTPRPSIPQRFCRQELAPDLQVEQVGLDDVPAVDEGLHERAQHPPAPTSRFDVCSQSFKDFVSAGATLGACQNMVRVLKSIFSCLLYTSPSPRDATLSRMPSSA